MNQENMQNPIRQSLLDILQQGGYILYTRHAQANVGEDQPYLNFWNCFTQRNLSEFGRSQAVTYGEMIRRLHITIMYPVLTSPFCRNRETASLAFGAEYAQVEPFLVGLYSRNAQLSAAERKRMLYILQSILEIEPLPGTNKVIIAHALPPGVGFGEIPEMETVVVKPRGQGNGFEVVVFLSLEEMSSLLV
jgi:phosphohistidine phosphatase SixA